MPMPRYRYGSAAATAAHEHGPAAPQVSRAEVVL